MTAIVAVLNKHAVAIAADSAVTMGGIHKVVNSANKIFTLSKYHPVAIMTYNNAVFMGTPWDIIIKEYRKQLKERSFPYLKDYMGDFISYVREKHFFCEMETQRACVKILLDSFFQICYNEIYREKGNISKDEFNIHIEEWLKQFLENNKDVEKCPDFISYKLQGFKKYIGDIIRNYAELKHFKNNELLMEAYFLYLSSNFSTQMSTGLVFVGYGENEIYPSLLPIDISLGFDGRLRYYIGKEDKISELGTHALIVPFAQTDVTQTIINGINPAFLGIIQNVIIKSIVSFGNEILNRIDSRPGNEDISRSIRKLNLYSIHEAIIHDINKDIRESYTDHLLNTVVSLDKDDMANMAESFIALTSLVRRMQPGAETVGGPVDVAVISKGDGFVWINRKHYFKPEFNSAFFSNYFK